MSAIFNKKDVGGCGRCACCSYDDVGGGDNDANNVIDATDGNDGVVVMTGMMDH